MKTLRMGLYTILSVLLMQCGAQEEQLKPLYAQIDSLTMALSERDKELMALTTENDDQTTLINELTTDLTTARGEAKPAPQAIAPIRQLIKDVHAGWEDLGKSKSKEALMSNFLEKYSVNAVRFDVNKIPNVNQENYKTFEDHLNVLIEGRDLSINFGNVEILASEVKDDFFYVAFKTTARIYHENKEVVTKSVISVISGKLQEKAKIGNYSWVSIDE